MTMQRRLSQTPMRDAAAAVEEPFRKRREAKSTIRERFREWMLFKNYKDIQPKESTKDIGEMEEICVVHRFFHKNFFVGTG